MSKYDQQWFRWKELVSSYQLLSLDRSVHYDYWKRAGLPKGTEGGTMRADSVMALKELRTTSFQESTVSLRRDLTTERQKRVCLCTVFFTCHFMESKWYLSDIDNLVPRAWLKDSRSPLLQKVAVSLGSCSQLGSTGFLSHKAVADLKSFHVCFWET